jgi:hypothetical protein
MIAAIIERSGERSKEFSRSAVVRMRSPGHRARFFA